MRFFGRRPEAEGRKLCRGNNYVDCWSRRMGGCCGTEFSGEGNAWRPPERVLRHRRKNGVDYDKECIYKCEGIYEASVFGRGHSIRAPTGYRSKEGGGNEAVGDSS